MNDESNEHVRRLLETHLGGRLNEREWQRLNEEGLIPQMRVSAHLLDELVALIRDRRATWGAPADEEREQREQEEASVEKEVEVILDEDEKRLAALAQIVVQVAQQDPSVHAYRTQYLGGRLIPENELVSWMEGRSQDELPGLPIPYLNRSIAIEVSFRTFTNALSAKARGDLDKVYKIPVPPESQIPKMVEVTAQELAQAEIRKVSFYLPKEGKPSSVQMKIQQDGLLYRLYQLGAQLAADYGWSEAEAVTFVLTGYPPRIIPARYKVEMDRVGIPALGRVVLTLDPAVAPKSVTNVYRQARQQALSGGRVRELSDKHRQLALFALEQSPETSVDEQMAKWNAKYAKYPQMQYNKRSYFARDARVALARLQQQQEK